MRYLSRYWMNRLKDVPKIRFNTSFDNRQSCGIANIEIKGADPVRLVGHLMEKYKIYTTPIVHDEFKGIRITPNVYTTLHELDRFCEAMEAVARRGIS